MNNNDDDTCYIIHIVADVDECLNNNGGCSHKCVNMAGTYRCECPPGSILHSNGHDCTGEYTLQKYCNYQIISIVPLIIFSREIKIPLS